MLDSIDRLTRTAGNAAAWLFLLAAVIACYEVAMDSVFGAPTIWVHDATIMLTAICFLLGGAYAMQSRSHIRITVIYDLLPAGLRRICDILGGVVVAAYLATFSWIAVRKAVESVLVLESSGRAWDVPMPMVIRLALALGVVLLLLQSLANLGAILRGRSVE
jgi:TRAP-type mannitol/chloroaromatic compound transport system permease small subunit